MNIFKKRLFPILLSLIILSGCSITTEQINNQANPNISSSNTSSEATTDKKSTDLNSASSNKSKNIVSGSIKIHFIDVGQADSILIQTGKSNMLIDAGNNNDGYLVVDYLESQGVKKLDYVIGTHPHEDHIGGLDNVINSFDIGKIIMPKVSNNTKTFEDVLNAISNKGLKVTTPIPETNYSLSKAKFKILAPNSASYEDLNNYSIVIKLTFGKNTFLFEGDAEDIPENEMIANGYNLKADLLKVGHHGSNSSTTSDFLKLVSPKYAVISVGLGNTYGHPTPETISKLNNAGIKIFRTDESGTIVVTSNGKTIKINKNASHTTTQVQSSTYAQDSNQSSNGTANKYIGNKNTKKFHLATCSYLPLEKNRVYFKTREDAIKANYIPCKICKP